MLKFQMAVPTSTKMDLRSTRRRIRDYAIVGLRLFAQRIVIYTAAILLAGAYYDWVTAAAFYVLVLIGEAYDFFVFRNILDRRTWIQADIGRSMSKIYVGTIFSSTTISLFAISFASQQSPETGHFMPMFMLVSASIFATMNNHHFLPVLATRLAIYVSAILFIPIYDLWITSAPLQSEVWLHFFTVIFVLGFLLELAREFISSYNHRLKVRLDLESEHQKTKAAYIAKTEFLATVSHELRTPLTSIKGGLEMINSGVLGELPEKMSKPFEIAVKNTRKLATLVDDLLLLQSAESGKLSFKFESVDIGELVAKTVERFIPFAESAKVAIRVESKQDGSLVKCDAKRIEQVMTNLLSNAAKFSHEHGDITISIEEMGESVRVSVADNGIGIPDGSEAEIFEAFGQLDSSDTRKFQGTGLGLNISERIVEAHGGQIGYTSILGEGSTFFFDLRAARS
jgi:signal transduction histidine kinase